MRVQFDFDPAEVEQSAIAMFERQVRRDPDAPAVVTAAQALTYAELNRRANRLAHAIVAARESKPEAVAMLVEHGIAPVVAILGILKAGKYYVPLDPALPDARLGAILKDSEATLLVTNTLNRERAAVLAGDALPVLTLETLPDDCAETNPGIGISPDALLNLMYTSGSTGESKGVIQTHRNLMHAIVAANFPSYLRDERFAQLTPFSFGGSAATLFRGIYFGATLYPFNLRQAGLGQFAAFLDANAITRFHTVPTVLRNWLEILPPDKQFPHLRVIEVGGEPLFKRDLERVLAHVSAECLVRNALGTTESYIAAWNFLKAGSEVPDGVVSVGYAAPEMQVLILDEQGQSVPPGETGEIFVRSKYISPGYWRKPELSSKTFLRDPADADFILWKTGDLGRLRETGELDHLGRKDGMVKIRGNQVVLTFVESAVRALDKVKDAAVVALPNAAGDLRLVAYLVPAEQSDASARIFREALSATLPDYMVPSTFLFVEELPKLPNGKLDRRNLPAPEDARPEPETSYVAPRTPLERQLADIWRQVLGVERVGVQDAFVELGGNSLQAAQIVARASVATGVEIPLSAVFAVPTIEGLAQLVTQRMAEQVQTQDLERMLREAEALN